MSGPAVRRWVVGFGQELRRDDAVGLHVVRRLRERGRIDAELREAPADPTALLGEWVGVALEVVDATRSGRPPGTVTTWTPSERSLATPPANSSHGLSFPEVYRLAVALGQVPRSVRVHGIEAGDVGLGEGLTPAVAAAVPRVVAQIEDAPLLSPGE